MLKSRPLTLFRISFALLYSSVGVLFPYYVLYFKSVGLDYAQIGMLLATSGIVTLLFSQLWGYTADVLLGKRMVLTLTTIGCATFFLGLKFAYLFWHFLILIFFLRFFSTPRAHVINSLLFLQPGGKENFALVRSYGSLGFIVMNLVTGKLSTALGLDVIFPLYAFVSLLFLISIWSLPEPQQPFRTSKTYSFWHVQKILLKNPCILLLLIVVFFHQSAHSSGTIYLSFVIKENGGNEAIIGLFYSYAAVLEIPLFFILDRIIAVVGEVKLIAIAIIAQIIRWILTFFAVNLDEFFIIQSLHCITFGLFYLAGASYINRQSPDELKASAQTLLAMVYFGVALMFSQIVGGTIAEIKGLRALYLFTSAFAGIGFIVWIKLALTDSKMRKA